MKLKLSHSLAALALALAAPLAAQAQQLPGKHPGYLHALSDLRAARDMLFRQPGDARVSAAEDVAIREIEDALGEIRKASIDDGKNLNDHPPVDTQEHGSKLLRAIETLKAAKNDVSGEEDNPQVRELRHHTMDHINHAIQQAEKAHAEWLKEARK